MVRLVAVRVRNSFSKVDDRPLVTGLFVEGRRTADSPDAAMETSIGMGNVLFPGHRSRGCGKHPE